MKKKKKEKKKRKERKKRKKEKRSNSWVNSEASSAWSKGVALETRQFPHDPTFTSVLAARPGNRNTPTGSGKMISQESVNLISIASTTAFSPAAAETAAMQAHGAGSGLGSSRRRTAHVAARTSPSTSVRSTEQSESNITEARARERDENVSESSGVLSTLQT